MENKILTISVAAYNVQDYIENTLKSLLVKNINDLEILVEDDGGTDNTANIVKEYEKKYPGIVKLIHKENGGYGSTINKSIELAKGKYFKQLDGDDWYDSENFEKLLEILRNTDTDCVYTPYREYIEKTKTYNIKDFFDETINGKFEIEEIISKANHYLSMYTVCYKTELLRKLNVKLLHKCFYTDTQYALYPMAGVKDIYICHNNLYIYRIGRKDQSISMESRLKHYKDSVKVSYELNNFYNSICNSVSENVKSYILNYVALLTQATIMDFMMLFPIKKDNKNMIIQFENRIMEINKAVYDEMARKRKLIRYLRKSKYMLYIPISIFQKHRVCKKN